MAITGEQSDKLGPDEPTATNNHDFILRLHGPRG